MATAPDDEPTQELMPMLNALRKAKLHVELSGETARVSFRKDDSRSVEAYDLVYQSARGRLPVATLVEQVLERLESVA